jgi:hypothetical protein
MEYGRWNEGVLKKKILKRFSNRESNPGIFDEKKIMIMRRKKRLKWMHCKLNFNRIRTDDLSKIPLIYQRLNLPCTTSKTLLTI